VRLCLLLGTVFCDFLLLFPLLIKHTLLIFLVNAVTRGVNRDDMFTLTHKPLYYLSYRKLCIIYLIANFALFILSQTLYYLSYRKQPLQ
jgi:hypothetical protein